MITVDDLRELDGLAHSMQAQLLNDAELAAMYHAARQLIAKGLDRDTGLRLHEGEDWLVTCDSPPPGFDEWWDALPDSWATVPLRQQLQEAWQASRKRHTARLRRVGWLDQRGRVWLEVPPAGEFDGGSLTPLLIDVRGDS